MSTTTASPTAQFRWDLFVTALEGGINYWARCSHYHIWKSGTSDAEGDSLDEDLHGFYAAVRPHETDEGFDPSLVIDYKVIGKGYALATTEWRDRLHWSSGEKPPLFMSEAGDWDFDASDADVIVQLGLFGEVRYG